MSQTKLMNVSNFQSGFQLAISAAHEVDYLLTWNYAHLANPVAQQHLHEICERRGLRVPLLVSPETIPIEHVPMAYRVTK